MPSSASSEIYRKDSDTLAFVPVSQTPIERFEEYLVARGLRHTDQRRFLVEQVFSRHEHFNADQ
ncbi:MAG: hypothetical protein U0930_06475 [Pirellulales bacterium]